MAVPKDVQKRVVRGALKGRTPAQALREALKRKALPPIVPDPEETAETEAEKLVA